MSGMNFNSSYSTAKPYIKQDIVSYNLNSGKKSKVPQMVTKLTQEYTNSIYPFLGYRLYEKTEQGYKKTEVLFQVGEEILNVIPDGMRTVDERPDKQCFYNFISALVMYVVI